MTDFTPGPWQAYEPNPLGGGQSTPFGTAAGNPLGAVFGIGPVGQANARLIAAAPYLLDSLRACVAVIEALHADRGWHPEYVRRLAAATAAIEKAIG